MEEEKNIVFENDEMIEYVDHDEREKFCVSEEKDTHY